MKELEKQVRKPINAILLNMEIGDEEMYPRVQYRSLRTTISAINIERGMKFQMNVLPDVIQVSRIV